MSRYPTPISPCQAVRDQQAVSNQRSHESVPYYYVALAIEVLAERDLDIDENDRLDLTVRLALQARDLFYASALYEPSDVELDRFFQEFIVRSFIADLYQEAA